MAQVLFHTTEVVHGLVVLLDFNVFPSILVMFIKLRNASLIDIVLIVLLPSSRFAHITLHIIARHLKMTLTSIS